MTAFRRVAAICIAALVPAALAHASAGWTPPLGIPSPSFGIIESAPPAPRPWTRQTPGFYYVDAARPQATDEGNAFGTPERPRKTIPILLPAGAVVELHGAYDFSHSSPRTITAQGTKAAPVFIRGPSRAARPTIRNAWEVRGTYVVLENLDFGPLNATQTGALALLAPGSHLVLRHCELHGNLNGGGMGIESWAAGASIHDVVVYDNFVHDNGNVHADRDQDVHGIHVGGRASAVWVVDNEMARNSGDGIQINAGTRRDQPSTHHLYIGRNISHDNKQTGFWAKQAVDVVFSQNLCYGHRTGNSSYGQCMGYQYATDWIWFIFNHIEDSDSGIAASSDSDLGMGTHAYFIGNVIHNIHPQNAKDSNPSTGWSSAGIMLAGGVHRSVVNNTIDDVEAGINAPAAEGTLEIADNIIARVTRPQANHVFVEMARLAAQSKMHHNLLDGEPRVRWGGEQIHVDTRQLAAAASLAGAARFVDPDHEDFHLQPSSPAIGVGELNAAYHDFLERYGLSIAVDPDGTPRSRERGAVDLGAYAASTDSPCRRTSAPAAPSGLAVSRQGRHVTLTWTRPASCGVPVSYVFEIATAPGQPSIVRASTGSDATTFSTASATPGRYYVRVRAQNVSGISRASNEVLIDVP